MSLHGPKQESTLFFTLFLLITDRLYTLCLAWRDSQKENDWHPISSTVRQRGRRNLHIQQQSSNHNPPSSSVVFLSLHLPLSYMAQAEIVVLFLLPLTCFLFFTDRSSPWNFMIDDKKLKLELTMEVITPQKMRSPWPLEEPPLKLNNKMNYWYWMWQLVLHQIPVRESFLPLIFLLILTHKNFIVCFNDFYSSRTTMAFSLWLIFQFSYTLCKKKSIS